MSQEDFLALIEDAEVFHVINSAALAGRIYTRTCKYLNIGSDSFDLGAILVALLLCAQSKFNDTLVASSAHIKDSGAALSEIFKKNFIPLARRLQLQSILKEDFMSDECLARVRSVYGELQSVFDKRAAKYRDIPSTIPYDDVEELLRDARLLTNPAGDPRDSNKVRKWHHDVQQGLIFGRSVMLSGDADHDGDPPPENEVTFPEFIEMVARAGFARYYNREIGADLRDHPELPSIVDCYWKGIDAVLDETNYNSQLKNQPVVAKGGQRGQKK